MDDWELLQEYANGASEAAFAELVQRHLDWVHSVARRNVHDPHLASDVAQSVFVLLARKAGSLPRGVILTGWLFRTTRFVALRAWRNECRRRNREQSVPAVMPTNPSDDSDRMWHQVSGHLDQAVASLSERDRSAILLRFYEARSVRDVSGRLGISEDAAKKRIGRAVEKMRRFLLKRGVGVAGVGLMALLSEKTVEAAPAMLGASVLKTVRLAASGTGTLPELVRQILAARRMLAWKVTGAVFVVSIATGLTALRIASRNEPAAPGPMTGVAATAEQAEVKAEPASPITNQGHSVPLVEDDLKIKIIRSLDRQASALDRVAVRYHIEVAQEMPPEEIEARAAEVRQRLGLQDTRPPGIRLAPLPVLVECVWVRSNDVEYLETFEHNVGGQVLHQKRLVSAERTILWRAPDNLWSPRLKGDFARVLITTNRGAGWVPGWRFARFYGEDERGNAVAETLRGTDWVPARVDTASGKHIHKLRETGPWVDNYTEMGFDEDRGYSPVSRTIVAGGKTNLDWTVEDSREVAPGVWLPLRITDQNFWPQTGEPLTVFDITVDDIKVSEEVPANAMELQWDPGSLVVDEIKGVQYREGLSAPEPIGSSAW